MSSKVTIRGGYKSGTRLILSKNTNSEEVQEYCIQSWRRKDHCHVYHKLWRWL